MLKRCAFELIGIQETRDIIDELARSHPALVAEVVGKSVSLFQLTDILRRLVEEQICIRNLRTIFFSLAEWGSIEHDTVMLTEYVRASLKREISYRLSGGTGTFCSTKASALASTSCTIPAMISLSWKSFGV